MALREPSRQCPPGKHGQFMASTYSRLARVVPVEQLRLQMLNTTPLITIVIALTFLIGGCQNPDDVAILGHWNMTAIRYEDGSEQALSGANAVIIDSDHVTEVYEGQGRRRYPYRRNGTILWLDAGGSRVNWTVVSQGDKSLELDTPIGTYLLTR